MTRGWRGPAGQRRLAVALVAVAVVWSSLYAVQLLIDIARPRTDLTQPVVGLLGPGSPTALRVTFWAVVGGWALTGASWAVWAGYRRVVDRAKRGSGWVPSDPPPTALQVPSDPPPTALQVPRLVTAAVLLLPFTVLPATIAGGHPLVLLACLPSTAFGLWLVSRLQRYRRVPVWLLLGCFGWAALLATGFGGAQNLWVYDYGPAYFLSRHPDNPFKAAHDVYTATFASAGLFEELGKGSAVVLAYLLFRRHVDDVVGGIVLGATAGLGFNLVESVEYIAAADGAGGFQYWLRQSVGLMGAHTAFTAMVGAGVGLARQLPTLQGRITAIAAGYLTAAGAHFANDALIRWWGQNQPRDYLATHTTLDVLVVQPLLLVVLQGPFVVAYLVLWRRGLRIQVAGLTEALRAEVGSGSGAVTGPEVAILTSPGRRLWLRATVLRRHGWSARNALVAVQNAQYDLAVRLWHRRSGQDPDEPEAELRQRIRAARLRLAGTLRAAQPGAAAVPGRAALRVGG